MSDVKTVRGQGPAVDKLRLRPLILSGKKMMHLAQSLFRCERIPASRGALALLVAAAALAIMPSSASAQDDECFEWRAVEPTARAGHRLAWDARRNVMVMFGGVREYLRTFSNTWEWDGRRWSLRAVDGPSSRRGMDMVYDERRGVVVLFGGTDSQRREYYGDTWEWDGVTWHERQVEGPFARAYHAMTYDSDRGVVVLTSGETEDGEVYETWEWDGVAWTLRDANEPRIQFAHRLAYDSQRRVAVAVGYSADRTPHNGTVWEWDGNAWTRRDAGGPDTGRWSAGFDYDAARRVCVLVSGFPYNDVGDMWEWDGESWTQRPTPPTGGRDAADMVYDPVSERLVLAGGGVKDPQDRLVLTGDIWVYENDEWQEVHASPPSAYSEAIMSYDARRDVTLLLGGRSDEGGDLPVWEWNGREWRRQRQSAAPPRYAQEAVFDTALGETIVFFEVDPDDPLDLWTWRGHKWTEYPLNNSRRVRNDTVTLAYDQSREVAVIVAEVPGDNEMHTWEWRGRENQLELVQVAGLPLRRAAAMTYDTARGVTVLAGGLGPDLGSTWEWDGDSWRRAGGDGPVIADGTMTYDTRREMPVMFAGMIDNERTNDVWRWNGEAWSRLEVAGDFAPLPRRYAGFVYDQKRDVYVSFGGDAIGDSGVTWELTPVVCCDDARKLAARCRKNGLVAKLRLTSDAYDGRTVTLLANGHWLDATVRGDRARAKFAGLTGSIEIGLETPSGCGLRRRAECN